MWRECKQNVDRTNWIPSSCVTSSLTLEKTQVEHVGKQRGSSYTRHSEGITVMHQHTHIHAHKHTHVLYWTCT